MSAAVQAERLGGEGRRCSRTVPPRSGQRGNHPDRDEDVRHNGSEPGDRAGDGGRVGVDGRAEFSGAVRGGSFWVACVVESIGP
jgi:hypothetical protein